MSERYETDCMNCCKFQDEIEELKKQLKNWTYKEFCNCMCPSHRNQNGGITINPKSDLLKVCKDIVNSGILRGNKILSDARTAIAKVEGEGI